MGRRPPPIEQKRNIFTVTRLISWPAMSVSLHRRFCVLDTLENTIKIRKKVVLGVGRLCPAFGEKQGGAPTRWMAFREGGGDAYTYGSVQPSHHLQSREGSRNVVVAVDANEESVAAFMWTLVNLYREGDSLHVLHVVPEALSSPASGSIYYPQPIDPETERALWRQAQEFIQDEFVEIAKSKGVTVNVVLVKESRHKHIGWAVCKKAEELQASPLVLACHHKSKLEEMLLGSVSKFCAEHCRQPVLLIHPDHSYR